MNIKNEIIQNLLQKYADHQISKEEYDQLLTYIKKNEAVESLEAVMDEDWKKLDDKFPFLESKSEALYKKIISNLLYDGQLPKRKSNNEIFRFWQYFAGVAAAMAVFTMAVWIYNKNKLASERHYNGVTLANDISSGGNKAVLTLANGKTISLSEAKTGIRIDGNQVTYDDGAAIGVLADGTLDPASGRIQTITTPKGGTYQITLADGTKVWLNAASSLTYSTNINETDLRRVKLEGEAYFEVAKDKAHPFIVESKRQKVEVLGTHFNISSYADDEIVKTTLLEGRIKVNEVILVPNQQSLITAKSTKIQQVYAENEVAWKNGEFIFNDEPLGSIMKEVIRWYDVEVEYKDPDISKKQFAGTITRFGNVSDLLKMLSLTRDVHFKIEGRRIVVTK